MHVLFVSHSARVGGAELGLVEGVRALTSRGHRVDVVLPGDGPLRARLTDTAPVHVVPHNPWVTQSDPPLTVAARWMAYNLAVASRNLSRLAASVEADVVISNTLTTMAPALGARLARRPHAWYIHEFGDGQRFLLGRQPTFAAMRRLAPACLVSSDALRRFFSTRLPRSELHVAHYAISVPELRRTRPEDDPRFRFLILGHKMASKGQMDALLALAALAAAGSNVELWLVGDGEPEYELTLLEAAKAHGVAHLVQFLPLDLNPFEQMCNADAVLVCSRSEGFGRVTVEAMKAGKPVIGTATGATPDLIRHGWNGFLYRQGDAQDLTHWADVLYRDRATAREMGQRGQQWATATFNEQECGSRLEAALMAVAKSRPSRPGAASRSRRKPPNGSGAPEDPRLSTEPGFL